MPAPRGSSIGAENKKSDIEAGRATSFFLPRRIPLGETVCHERRSPIGPSRGQVSQRFSSFVRWYRTIAFNTG